MMSKTMELLEFFSEDNYSARYAAAKAKNVCIRCGKPAHLFRDVLTRLEYRISALCQKCQDEYFK
jgi:hypothetical protein